MLVAVALLAGRKVDIATLRSLTLTWRWILASIALNTCSALLKASVWDSVLRGMPTPLKLPFRHLVRAALIGLCVNTVVPGRVGEVARVGAVKRRNPSAPVPILVGSIVGEHMLSTVAVVSVVAALLLGVDRGIAGRFESTLVALLLVMVALSVSLAAIVLVLRSERVRRSIPPVEEPTGGSLRLAREVAVGLRGGVAIFRRERRAYAAWGLAGALASSAAQVASIFAALSAVGIDASIERAGAAYIASTLVGIFPLIPGNIGAFQAVVAALRPRHVRRHLRARVRLRDRAASARSGRRRGNRRPVPLPRGSRWGRRNSTARGRYELRAGRRVQRPIDRHLYDDRADVADTVADSPKIGGVAAGGPGSAAISASRAEGDGARRGLLMDRILSRSG